MAGAAGVQLPDVELTAEDAAFAEELGAFLDEHLAGFKTRFKSATEADAQIELAREWQATMAAGCWAAINWPKQFGGRAATPRQQLTFHLTCSQRRVPPMIGRQGIALCGSTLIAHGTAAQRERFLPSMLDGRDIWCQGFSEPGAGSDLASLRTRADIYGDELVVTGQKIWTSGAQYSNWMFALVRTDPAAAKRQGISYVLIPMNADGVEVRPIRQLSGDSGFNEVFLDEVRVPLDLVVGQLNQGWSVTRTTLANERAVLFTAQQIALTTTLQKIVDEATTPRPDGWRAADDPDLRDRIARAWMDIELIRLNGERNLAKVLGGEEPGPEGAMSKLFGQHVEQQVHELALDACGPWSTLDRGSADAPNKGKWAMGWLRTKGSTIGGGTSEMQRNVLAERVLGQPRDPWADA